MLDAENAGRFLSGVRVAEAGRIADRRGRVWHTAHALLGTAHTKAGELIPGRLLSPLEIAQSQTQQAWKPGKQLERPRRLAQQIQEKVNHEYETNPQYRHHRPR
jgi:hypothetical protein